MKAPAATVDEYLARLPEDQRAALQELRSQIHAAAPGAEECVSYGLPGVRLHGVLVWFGAAKTHCAFYPHGLVEAFQDQLREYDTSKGTIRFQPSKPLPTSLVHAIVSRRVAEDMEKAALRVEAKRRPRAAKPK